MRSFQAVIVFLFALVAGVFAAETESYDATVYITSTVYRVNTVTMSGSAPSSAANSTTTITAPSYAAPSVTSAYGTGNSTGTGAIIKPTGNATTPATPEFTGAASSLNAPALVAALAAGLGFLVL
ncbi:hypothetical protein C7974DRAFT_413078 [Boeremia exigua]|uniref:uncharacterized protein n=1 Tax=Boeremia exigua TaxID=749465 RepID=UPI001E8CC57E|nr:uncharacterized protein C7974DRAFT_413078 [Boeremia exigua]KAH6629269.1 hypothetical protein C7974DRAFT_413078 [Boeremia exigua]